jgi:Uma2 family endonuclease
MKLSRPGRSQPAVAAPGKCLPSVQHDKNRFEIVPDRSYKEFAMAAALSPPPITIEQYLAFESPDGYRDELINGRIIVSPEAKPLHSDVADNLCDLLKDARDKKLHRVSQRMNLRFPDVDSMPSPDVFVMDLAEWQRSWKEETYPDGAKVLLAVEVISPSNRPGPLAEKVAIYLEHGIETWVVEPKKHFERKKLLTI